MESDGKLGYIDKEGNLVIDFRYDTATSFSEGLASVTEGEKSGYIDKEGNPAMEERFDEAAPFARGRAFVRDDGRWGVLDRGTLKIPWREDGYRGTGPAFAPVFSCVGTPSFAAKDVREGRDERKSA